MSLLWDLVALKILFGDREKSDANKHPMNSEKSECEKRYVNKRSVNNEMFELEKVEREKCEDAIRQMDISQIIENTRQTAMCQMGRGRIDERKRPINRYKYKKVYDEIVDDEKRQMVLNQIIEDNSKIAIRQMNICQINEEKRQMAIIRKNELQKDDRQMGGGQTAERKHQLKKHEGNNLGYFVSLIFLIVIVLWALVIDNFIVLFISVAILLYIINKCT